MTGFFTLELSTCQLKGKPRIQPSRTKLKKLILCHPGRSG